MKKRFDLFAFLLGYYRFSIPDEDCEKAVNLLLSHNLPGNIDANREIVVYSFRCRQYCSCFEDQLSFTRSALLGLPGAGRRIVARRGVLLALLLSAFLFLFTGGLVWDIRVEAPDGIRDEDVFSEAEEAGLFIGAAWRKIDRDRIEAELVRTSEQIGWASIERVGTVANISVREKEVTDRPSPAPSPCDVVANADCVIEEITVSSGVAVVAVGDAVRRGDVLISGVLPEEQGGGVCHAQGVIVGRMEETVCAHSYRTKTETLFAKEKLVGITVSFFDFPINIFKNTGNREQKCVIIEENHYPILPGDVRLPICMKLVYESAPAEQWKRNLSDRELITLTTARLRTKTNLVLSDADLVSVRTEGNFDEKGYAMTSYMSVLRSVGIEKPISE